MKHIAQTVKEYGLVSLAYPIPIEYIIPPIQINITKSKLPEYNVWEKMLDRCVNTRADNYTDYGDRGITVCTSWLYFENFLRDMGYRPNSKLKLERKDNNKGYSPANCKWATVTEQNRNKRKSRYYESNGKTLHLYEWATILKIDKFVLTDLIRRKQDIPGFSPYTRVPNPSC